MSLSIAIKTLLSRRLTPHGKEWVKGNLSPWLSHLCSHDPRILALLFGTDKWNVHWYAEHYKTHFDPIRKRPLNILEIGVGGYDGPSSGGASLRMWKRYFPRGRIFGIDINDKSAVQEPRIIIFQGSQDDPEFLQNVVQRMGGVDIVIDDGSHVNSHVITSFKTLFPLLASDGIYAVEDVQTSYWPKMGGNEEDRNSPSTIVGFFKSLVDGLNHEEFLDELYNPTYYDRHITAIHFYHNLIITQKGINNEVSRRRKS